MKIKQFFIKQVAMLFAAAVSVSMAQGVRDNNDPYALYGRPSIEGPVVRFQPICKGGYAPSIGGNKTYEYISSFSITPIGDKFRIEVKVVTPKLYEATNFPGYGTSHEYVNVWIDWNGDRTWSNDECVYSGDSANYSKILANNKILYFITTIKSKASTSGTVKARAMLGWGYNPTNPAQYSWSWGDVKDVSIALNYLPPSIAGCFVGRCPAKEYVSKCQKKGFVHPKYTYDDSIDKITTYNSAVAGERTDIYPFVKILKTDRESGHFYYRAIVELGELKKDVEVASNPTWIETVDGKEYGYYLAQTAVTFDDSENKSTYGRQKGKVTVFYTDQNMQLSSCNYDFTYYVFFDPEKDDADGYPKWFNAWKSIFPAGTMDLFNYGGNSKYAGTHTSGYSVKGIQMLQEPNGNIIDYDALQLKNNPNLTLEREIEWSHTYTLYKGAITSPSGQEGPVDNWRPKTKQYPIDAVFQTVKHELKHGEVYDANNIMVYKWHKDETTGFEGKSWHIKYDGEGSGDVINGEWKYDLGDMLPNSLEVRYGTNSGLRDTFGLSTVSPWNFTEMRNGEEYRPYSRYADQEFYVLRETDDVDASEYHSKDFSKNGPQWPKDDNTTKSDFSTRKDSAGQTNADCYTLDSNYVIPSNNNSLFVSHGPAITFGGNISCESSNRGIVFSTELLSEHEGRYMVSCYLATTNNEPLACSSVIKDIPHGESSIEFVFTPDVMARLRVQYGGDCILKRIVCQFAEIDSGDVTCSKDNLYVLTNWDEMNFNHLRPIVQNGSVATNTGNDSLDVVFTVVFPAASNLICRTYLETAGGKRISSSEAAFSVTSGVNRLKFSFDASKLYASKYNGRAKISELMMLDANGDNSKTIQANLIINDFYFSNYATPGQKVRILSDTIKVTAVEAEGGINSGICLEFTAENDAPNTANLYRFEASLSSTNGTIISVVDENYLMQSSNATYKLFFSGQSISSFNVDGPYVISGIKIMDPITGDTYDSATCFQLTTDAYNTSDFICNLKVCENVSYLASTNGIGEISAIGIRLPIISPAEGYITINSSVGDSNGLVSLDIEDTYVCTNGTNYIEVIVDSSRLWELNVDGPFVFYDISAYHSGSPELVINVQGHVMTPPIQRISLATVPVLCVDVEGNDINNGESFATAKRTIQFAVDAMTVGGGKIVVADGIYEPFTCTNRNIVIESVNGPRYTIIDGGGTNRCATLGTSAGHTNTVLRGFTLRNGNASGSAVKVSRNYGGGASFGTVDNCYVYGNKASYGSGISNARLLNSIVSGNEVNRGVVYFDRMPFRNVVKGCILARNKGDFASAIYIQDNNGKGVDIENCLFYENRVVAHWTVFDQLLDKSCNVRNSTVVNNQSGYGQAGIGYMSVDNSIVWNNRNHNGVVVNDSGTSSYLNSCMESLQAGNGNITNNPQFVDAEHHVYLLKANSPCIGMSSTGQHIGMCDVAEDEGFVVGTEVDGYGLILEPGTVVEAGRNVTFTAAEIGREFLHFKTNGVFATTNHIIEINNIQSDILVTAVFAKQQFFIDSINGSDINNGVSWRLAKQTIDSAIHDALDYDVITVTNGIYSSITPGEKKIKIMSVNGADYTIIDGNNKNRCVTCLEGGNGVTNSIVDGFTLRNGFSSSFGGGAIGGILRNCHIVDCEATTYGGGACDSHLENCVVARNKAGTYGGGTYYGYADHCTICGNEAGASSGGSYYGTFYNSIVSKNFVGGNEANWMYGTFDSCCTYPNRGNNPIAGDPMLVDGWNGDARLRVGSPCIEDGVQVCGAYVGEPLEGVSVSVGVCGAGAVSNETILVTSGDNATIEAVETVRPFLYWVINGEQITNHIYTITNLISDIRITAVFDTFDWYVDAEYGDDANDGSDWNVAKQTLQAAVAAAVDNENIYVESGTYGPISSDNKRIRIESMNGAELTFIDGGGTNRCAMLGQSGISYATNTVMSGFSIVNGFNASDGGAVCGGTLEDCILSDNTTYRNGGATYYSNLERCVLTRNTARFTGGGAYNGTLRNCLVFGNTSGNAGGGVSSVRAYNSTIARNKTEKLLSSSNCGSGGSYQGACYNTIVWDNRDAYGNVSNYNGTAFYYSCTLPQKGTACVTNDPQFIDADAGDFHLMVGSPCIDAGLNNYVHEDLDLEWDDRIQGVKVDVGCFEGAEYATPPGQVSGLCAVRGVLTWDEMPEAEGFMIYRSTRKAPASAKYIGFSDANTYIDETAVDGTTYYYWVMAFNTLGMGMRSEAAENTWPVLLSITTSELPDATEMEGYVAQLEAIGGTPPYSWSIPARGYIVSTNSASTFAEVGVAQGWNADDDCWTLELPFDFPFYGNKYGTAYINSNGTITFDGHFDRWTYSVQNFTNRVMIAALWSDIITSSGDVYVSANADEVTIRWAGLYHSSGGVVAASATLYANGTIHFAYGSGNVKGGFVGVSAGDGEKFIIIDNSSDSRNNAYDIVLRGGCVANGLSLSESGQITGVPTESGTNICIVTVTDAVGDMSERELSIVVAENPNRKPIIDTVRPTTNVYVKAGNSATFEVTAQDPEGATLNYSWYFDGKEIECVTNSYTFTATLDDAGVHTLECVVSDGLWTDMVRQRWSFRVVRDWYVDASAEDDSGDGASSGSALYSISEALWYAEDGDTIYVAPGLYDDFLEFDSGRTVSIIATGGTSRTFFTGKVDGYDTEWHPGEAVVQSTMRGFTFRGCYLGGATLDDCVLMCDEMGCYPSEVYGCRLFDCSVTGNVCDYSPIQRCELTRCTVAGNTVGEYGAIGYSSYVYDCIVWDNVTVNGETSNYDTETWYDEWWDDDAEEYVSEEYAEVHIFNSCTWPMPSEIAGTGNITSDPRLVDAENGDLRLRVGSPCFVGGAQTMGVCLGDPVAGFVLSVRIEGSGAVSPMTAVVSNGGNATFEVADNTRPFLGFSTNGVFATAADTLTWQGVKSDGIITAVFSNFTFYVDAAAGDDANDGLSWATARASIQSAINDAVRGETIYVKAGTYDPIVVGAAMRLRIESVDGKEAAVIDGGGERQCANLGGNDSFSSTLVGFTLTNGYSNYGGGAHGGTLIDCDVMGNYARYQGGGLYYSTAIRCQIAENKAGDTNLWSNANGGGAYSGILRNCLVVGNTAESSNYCEGGASCYSALYNCTVVDNVACGNGYGGGVAYGNLYNSVVFGNHADYDDETQYVWTTQKSLIGVDPGFIDAENGDYRLAVGSPCIDAGSNGYVLDDADLDGNERIQHYTVDIGCYEYELATPERDADADFAAQMAGTCYGVFVGVGRYTYTSSLTGPTIDATNMQARCIAKGYWRDENTVAFLDAAATKAVVRAKLATLAAKAVSGDTVLYYQSSHGGSHTSGGNYTKDAYICLHDERYEDYEMAEDLMQFAAGVKVVIILDTCHSAGMFKAMGMSSTSSAKSFALRVRDLMAERSKLRKSAKSGITAADIGWIAAADYNQYSWDSLKGGAFTVAMLDGWKSGDADYDGDNRLNFHELWRYAKGIATGYYGEDATDAQCLNENVLLSRFAGTPDSTSNGESTETTPAPVEHVWLDSYPAILAAFGGDYEAMANAPSPGASGSGKIWPNGSPCYMWQDFVAGTSPTNDAVFTATIRMDGDTPVITWEPDTPELRATRVYRTYGKKTLMDANWTDITDKEMSEYHFFKVTVDLP